MKKGYSFLIDDKTVAEINQYKEDIKKGAVAPSTVFQTAYREYAAIPLNGDFQIQYIEKIDSLSFIKVLLKTRHYITPDQDITSCLNQQEYYFLSKFHTFISGVQIYDNGILDENEKHPLSQRGFFKKHESPFSGYLACITVPVLRERDPESNEAIDKAVEVIERDSEGKQVINQKKYETLLKSILLPILTLINLQMKSLNKKALVTIPGLGLEYLDEELRSDERNWRYVSETLANIVAENRQHLTNIEFIYLELSISNLNVTVRGSGLWRHNGPMVYKIRPHYYRRPTDIGPLTQKEQQNIEGHNSLPLLSHPKEFAQLFTFPELKNCQLVKVVVCDNAVYWGKKGFTIEQSPFGGCSDQAVSLLRATDAMSRYTGIEGKYVEKKGYLPRSFNTWKEAIREKEGPTERSTDTVWKYTNCAGAPKVTFLESHTTHKARPSSIQKQLLSKEDVLRTVAVFVCHLAISFIPILNVTNGAAIVSHILINSLIGRFTDEKPPYSGLSGCLILTILGMGSAFLPNKMMQAVIPPLANKMVQAVIPTLVKICATLYVNNRSKVASIK